MKIKTQHYDHMMNTIRDFMEKNCQAINDHMEELKDDQRVKDHGKRLRWDIANASGLIPWFCSDLYPYMNDDHIDTALRHITGIM